MDVMTYLNMQTMPEQPASLAPFDPKWLTLEVLTPVGRLLNASVDEPRGFRAPDGSQQPPKYNITLGFSPGTDENPITDDLWDAVHRLADLAWPSVTTIDKKTRQTIQVTGAQMVDLGKAAGGYHCPIYDGDDKWVTDPQKFECYKGVWYINASMWPQTKSNPPKPQRPVCKRRDLTDCTSADEIRQLFYPGAFARAILQLKAYDNRLGGRGISTNLRLVQFANHGPKIRNVEFNADRIYGNALSAAPIGDEQEMDGAEVGVTVSSPTVIQQPVVQLQPSAPVPIQAGFAAPRQGLRRPGA